MSGVMGLKLEEKMVEHEPSSDIFLVKGTTGRDRGFETLPQI